MGDEGGEDASGVTDASEGNRDLGGEGEAEEEVVDAEVGAAADEDALVLCDQLTNDLDEGLRLARPWRTPDECDLAGFAQDPVDCFSLGSVQTFVDEDEWFDDGRGRGCGREAEEGGEEWGGSRDFCRIGTGKELAEKGLES